VYATYDINQFVGKHFIDATPWIQEATAADCTKRAIEVWSTKPVNTLTVWSIDLAGNGSTAATYSFVAPYSAPMSSRMAALHSGTSR
jgi:hypothetical protein